MTNPSASGVLLVVLALLVSSLVESVLLLVASVLLADSVVPLVSPVPASPPEPLPPHPSATSNGPATFGQHVRSLFTAGNRTPA
jgi:hypothetical protein